MKLLNTKRTGLLTLAGSMVATSAFAAGNTAIERSLADWVSLVSMILSFVCLAVFILYAGRYISGSKDGNATGAEGERVSSGIRNGIMTALVGIAICQAVIIVAQAFFA